MCEKLGGCCVAAPVAALTPLPLRASLVTDPARCRTADSASSCCAPDGAGPNLTALIAGGIDYYSMKIDPTIPSY